MIADKGPVFNSKILLFGEYSLMKGSMALSIPYEKFSGQLKFESEKSKHFSVDYLSEYLDFLEVNNLGEILDLSSFRSDLGDGLYFKCNIPISYGLGSSGAIVAAIYNAYSLSKENNKLEELKSIFSRMESYYHGKSSGLDPLVSFLNKAILITENSNLKTIDLSKETNQNSLDMFLIDTKSSGETQPLVNWFLKKYETEDYRNKILTQLIPINNNCIVNFLAGNDNALINDLRSLSEFTFENLNPMIPASIKKIWKKGLETGNYYLKLCGSGGGGMMLGFSNNLENAKHELQDYEIHPL